MATASETLCGLCEGRNKTRCADVWCPECEEGLCSECQEFHSVSKLSKSHEVITIDNYKIFSKEVVGISQYCSEHERKFQNYCPKHDQLCCPVCISSHHAQCVGLLAIEEAAKESKVSTSLQNIEELLRDIKHNLKGLMRDRSKQQDTIKEQKHKIVDQIKQIRSKVNSHLDKLEQQAIQDLTSAEDEVSTKVRMVIRQLKEKDTILDQLQQNYDYIKKYASNVQTFIGSKILEEKIIKEEVFLDDLIHDGNCQQSDLKFTPGRTILDFQSNVDTFGSFSLDERPVEFTLLKSKQKQAQIMSTIPLTRSYDECSLTFLKELKIPKGMFNNCVTGCTFSPDGKIIFADCDYNTRLVILNSDGSLNGEISLDPDYPFDVTCIGDKRIAVSCLNKPSIHIINKDSKSKECVITTEDCNTGVTYKRGTLIYCERSKGINTMSIESKKTSVVVKQGCSLLSYVAVSRNKQLIYYTNHAKDTVTCCNAEGITIWEYRDTNVLYRPRGIDTDKDDNVYVASYGNNNIVLISSDGKRGRKLLSEENKIQQPYGLNVDKDKNLMLVCCYRKGANLYKIS